MREQHRQFLTAMGELARGVETSLLEGLAARLEMLSETPSSVVMGQLVQHVAPTRSRDGMERMLRQWTELAPDLPPIAVATALRSAASVDEWYRERSSCELVWTGPTPNHSQLRRTELALLELVEHAKTAIVVVAFSVHRVPHVAAALLKRARNGVRVGFIMETNEDSGGAFDGDSVSNLGHDLRQAVEIYVWPFERRERFAQAGQRNFGVLHAKCAIADDDSLFVSSANFTTHALTMNMELGVLIRGGELPGRVRAHFDGLIAEGVLVRL